MRIVISESEHGEEILQRMEELSTLPGFKIYEDLMAFNTSIYILDKNFEELDKFVTDLTLNPKWGDLFLVENRHILHRISEDIVRRLHNFTASVQSLVDHTRRLYSKYYEDNNLIPEYEKEIRLRFAENPEAQFVQKLRQYCQHYASPLLTFQTSYNQSNRLTRVAGLRKAELIRFDSWGVYARNYLDESTQIIDFLAAIHRYHNSVLEFYKWFQKKQEVIHKNDLAEFRDREGELLCLMLDDKLEECLTSDDPRIRSEAYLYHHMFTKPDIETLSTSAKEPKSRVDAVTMLLEERFKLSDELKEKITKVYSLEGFRYFDDPHSCE